VVRVPRAFHRATATIVELTLDGDAMKLPVIQVSGRRISRLASRSKSPASGLADKKN